MGLDDLVLIKCHRNDFDRAQMFIVPDENVIIS